ncbi:hypothetical protein [Paenibacillus campi]|uniref:hypothetical protein n=1 Tax=Paenibacillus campi TaxID=3106031 RepID=UPI002AFE00A3|nr:hypothetical protein [Paenibacillus sp. SGZ-1009]
MSTQNKLKLDGTVVTPTRLLQAFGEVGVKDKIVSAYQQHKVSNQLFTDILQQEVDTHDYNISFTQNKDTAKKQLYQIASNILQKLALNPVLHTTGIFYDSVEQKVMKETVIGDLEVANSQLAIFPASMQNKLSYYYQIVSLSQNHQPIMLEARTVYKALEEMQKHLDNYIVQTKKQWDNVMKRFNDDHMLEVAAPKILDYLNYFKHISKPVLVNYPLKNLNDNLLLITQRLDALYADMNRTNPKPTVYLHTTATDIVNAYISRVHNNWNSGRTDPHAASNVYHIHIESAQYNVLYTMKNNNKDLYILGYVNWHLDGKMTDSQQRKIEEIKRYSNDLNSFLLYMKHENGWITQKEWYKRTVANYLNIQLPI